MATIAIPKFTILPDHYTRSAADEEDRDIFALESRLGPVFDVLRHKDTETPICMAIYGSVGTGKTTALNWLARQIELWNAIPKHERCGHPAVMAIRVSARKCAGAGAVAKTMVAELLLQSLVHLDTRNSQQRLDRVKKAANQCGGTLGRGFLQGLECVARRWGVLETLRAALVGMAVEAQGGDACYDGCLDLLNDWLRDFEERDSAVRLAVLIDDLDHVQPELMVAVFDTVNLHLRHPKLEFVAALDPHIAKTLLKEYFAKHDFGEAQSRYYLSKMFQVECDIEPSQHQVKAFYESQYKLLNRKSNQRLSAYVAPEYKGAIDAAILHLSAGNPRKIKLLLNSALMKGYAAIRSLEASGTDKEGTALVFVQNIQVFLLQRWLSYFSVGSAAIYRDDVLGWFDAISQEARSGKVDFTSFASHHEGCEGGRGVPAGMGLHMIHPWVWDLLAIPFSADLAGNAQPDVCLAIEPEPVVAEIRTDDLQHLSRGLKDAIAAALEKAASDLSVEDVAKVAELDLTGHQFTDADLAFLGKLENLQRLDLYNSSIQDLGRLAGLQRLKNLNLTCTPVTDISALQSIASLETLDLSFSNVRDLSPLKDHQELNALILYGTPVKEIGALRDLKKLSRLNLACTEVADDQMDIVETLPALNTLFLRQNKVSAARAAQINKHFDFGLKIDR